MCEKIKLWSSNRISKFKHTKKISHVVDKHSCAIRPYSIRSPLFLVKFVRIRVAKCTITIRSAKSCIEITYNLCFDTFDARKITYFATSSILLTRNACFTAKYLRNCSFLSAYKMYWCNLNQSKIEVN